MATNKNNQSFSEYSAYCEEIFLETLQSMLKENNVIILKITIA